MSITKTQAVLAMYDDFLEDHQLTKSTFMANMEISDITFKRYISELRCYFANFAPRFEIHYNRETDTYYLEDRSER